MKQKQKIFFFFPLFCHIFILFLVQHFFQFSLLVCCMLMVSFISMQLEKLRGFLPIRAVYCSNKLQAIALQQCMHCLLQFSPPVGTPCSHQRLSAHAYANAYAHALRWVALLRNLSTSSAVGESKVDAQQLQTFITKY